jgi:2-methylisocitrate lyase-like PEP mutase family enzyme
MTQHGNSLRKVVTQGEIIPLIGVYDVFSASIAARHFNGLFVSGFSFAASHYGLPDIGFIAWSDIVAFSQRLRILLPQHHIVVDIDDGYCDMAVAVHAATVLERAGISGVILEDQKRPRRCGHMEGKELLDIDSFLEKLQQVLENRHDLFVIARTDASEPEEILKRTQAYAKAGADAILADGIKDLNILPKIKEQTGMPLVFNQMAGGKSPPCSLTELQDLGVSIVNYSTPCLFAAQNAVEVAMQTLKENDGRLSALKQSSDLNDCSELLQENISLRDGIHHE